MTRSNLYWIAGGFRATATRQPAGGPSDPNPQAVSAKGAHRAQDYDAALFLLALIQAPAWIALALWR